VNDLETYVAELDETKVLLTIEEEVDYNYQITKILQENDVKRAVLFKKVKGSSIPLLANLSSPDLLSLSLKEKSDEIHSVFEKALVERGQLQKNENAPFLKNKLPVDFAKLPIPKFFASDGGRYLTSAIVIAKDPETDIPNMSIHRMLILGKDTCAIRLVPRHLRQYWEKAKKRGEDLAVAVVIGVHPAVSLAASTSIDYNDSELTIAAALMGGKLEITEVGTKKIPVPVHLQIVLEGVILKDQLSDEGPFVDITGTSDIVRREPVMKFSSMYMKDQAIMTTVLPAGTEHFTLMGFPREVTMLQTIRKVVPTVKKVYLTPGGSGWLHAVISLEPRKEGDGKNAILAAFTGHPSLKWVTIVNPDIDIYNPKEVEWATITRTGEGDISQFSRMGGSSLDPMKAANGNFKVGIDATIPLGGERSKFEKVALDYS
jgi:UbiD family decarboxylase